MIAVLSAISSLDDDATVANALRAFVAEAASGEERAFEYPESVLFHLSQYRRNERELRAARDRMRIARANNSPNNSANNSVSSSRARATDSVTSSLTIEKENILEKKEPEQSQENLHYLNTGEKPNKTPLQIENAYVVGSTRGLSKEDVDDWWLYYSQRNWRASERGYHAMNEIGALASLYRWASQKWRYDKQTKSGVYRNKSTDGFQNASETIDGSDIPN